MQPWPSCVVVAVHLRPTATAPDCVADLSDGPVSSFLRDESRVRVRCGSARAVETSLEIVDLGLYI